MYIFCSKCFKAFLEGHMSKDKQSPFLAIKNYSFFVWGTVIYLTHDYLFLYSILAASLTTGHR